MSTGWETRLEILRQDTEREVERGEYIVVAAERAGVEHRVAIMYTSGTANAVYKLLQTQVEHIFIRGSLERVDELAYGVTIPISSADEFHGVLIGWNNASSTDKFAPNPISTPRHGARQRTRACIR